MVTATVEGFYSSLSLNERVSTFALSKQSVVGIIHDVVCSRLRCLGSSCRFLFCHVRHPSIARYPFKMFW